VENRFRVSRTSDRRWLGGSSYGALIALHVAVTRPGLVSRLLLESPSFYVDGDHVLRDAQATDLNRDRVDLGVGTNELGLEGCAEHTARAWARRFPGAIRFLAGR
jgi:predicted alpha/beta superfamily hydrolase